MDTLGKTVLCTHLTALDAVLSPSEVDEQRPLGARARRRVPHRVVVVRPKVLPGRVLVQADVRVERVWGAAFAATAGRGEACGGEVGGEDGVERLGEGGGWERDAFCGRARVRGQCVVPRGG